MIDIYVKYDSAARIYGVKSHQTCKVKDFFSFCTLYLFLHNYIYEQYSAIWIISYLQKNAQVFKEIVEYFLNTTITVWLSILKFGKGLKTSKEN